MKKKLIFVSCIILGVSAIVTFLKEYTPQNIIHTEVEAQTASADWPQNQHDAQQTGRTSVSVAPNYTVAWAFADKNHIVKNFTSSINTSIDSAFEPTFRFNTVYSQQMQPIVADGKAFFGDLDGTMYAVNALTGDFIWEYKSNGAIFSSAAYINDILIFTSLDGKIYGLNADTGTKLWEYQTGAGINTAPVVANSIVYVGSRDGAFYALQTSNGNLKWKYNTRVAPINTASPFNNAPIVSHAAVSEDGQTVLFGAENMFFYALNTADGTEKWAPKKLIGQSFLYGWPVVANGKVIVRTMSSLAGAEWVTEAELDALPSNPTLNEEKTAINNWLAQNPNEKTLYVFDIATGQEPFQVPMGRVTGNNYTSHPSIIDNNNRVLTYWRSKISSFFSGGTFGSKYCPDFGAIDMNTGDRIKITPGVALNSFCPELDNGFQPTVGGNYLYLGNHFRGTHSINLTNGALTRMTTQAAKFDGGDFRGWGFQIIYYGNDSEPVDTRTTGKPPSAHSGTQGFVGISIADVSGTPMLFVNEGDAGFIVAIKRK